MSGIGQTLKEIRKKQRMTQSELADGIVNRSYISQIEKDLVQPSFKTMNLLAKRLDVDISMFYENLELRALSGSEIKNQIKNAKYQLESNNLTLLENTIRDLLNTSDEGFSKLSPGDQTDYYYVLSSYYFNRGDVEKTLEYTEKGILLAQQHAQEKVEIDFLIRIAKVYVDKNEYHVALDYLNKANELILSGRMMDQVKVDVLLNMGICHGRIGEYYSGIRLCEEALHINRLSQSSHKSGELFMTLGICYRNVNDLTSSKNYYEKAMKYFDLFDQQYNKAGILINLAILAREEGEFDACITMIQDARRIFEKLDDAYQCLNCDVELFKTHVVLPSTSSLKEEFESLDSLIPASYDSLKRDLHTAMLHHHLSEKDYKNALLFLTDSINIEDKSLYLAQIFYHLDMWEESSSSFMDHYVRNTVKNLVS